MSADGKERTPPVDPLLSIGVFARRSRLSMKALRLYGRKGLLTPADVDPDTGYRRYRESQLTTARLIVMLRRLNMPLAQVADTVSAPSRVAAELLTSYWTVVERRVASQRELMSHITSHLLGDDVVLDLPDVRERDVAGQLVLIEVRHVEVEQLPSWIGTAMSRLMASAQRYGGMSGSPFVVYHGEINEDSDGPAEACVPIDPPREESRCSGMRLEPAHREAYLRIRKSQVEFPQMLSAYDGVARWIRARGRVVAGPPREVYFTDFVSAAPNDEVCDVAFPIE
jgi:DNA-binding transcriptional MerR regulator/effector-binding domain-containing protein